MDNCNHIFKLAEIIYYRRGYSHSRSVYWHRIDRFFCEKCLYQEEVKKEEMTYGERPDWFQENGR